MKKPVKLNPNVKVIVAIDFGTTGSGYAFQPVDPNIKDPDTIACVNYHNHQKYKNLSAIVYEGTQPKAWGFKARKIYADSQKQNKKNYYYLQNFKLEILQLREGKEPKIEKNGRIFNVQEVIGDYLGLMKESILEFLRENNQPTEDEKIFWCLTVPAIWTDQEKQLMKESARKAGLLNYPDQFVYSYGKESPSIYFLKEGGAAMNLKNKQTLAIVDAGGGTVDITSYIITQINEGQSIELEQLYKASGEACGGIYVDQAWWEYLDKRLGASDFNISIKSFLKDPKSFAFVNNWEDAKKNFNYENEEEVTIEMDSSFSWFNANFKKKLQQLEDEQFYSDDLCGFVLNNQQMKDFISIPIEKSRNCLLDVIEKSLEVVKSQYSLHHVDKLDYLIFVGGFGGCVYYQQVLFDSVSHLVQKKLIPSSGSSAVLLGAAKFAKQSFIKVNLVKKRRLTTTYGILSRCKYDPSKHLSSKIIKDPQVGNLVEIFDVLARKNDLMETNQQITREFDVVASGTVLNLILVKSDLDNPVYASDGISICTLKMATNPSFQAVSVSLTFGSTSIGINCVGFMSTNETITVDSEVTYDFINSPILIPSRPLPASPSHYIFVIDTSGSMNGEPIQAVKNGLDEFMNIVNHQLNKTGNDIISVILFGTAVKTVVKAQVLRTMDGLIDITRHGDGGGTRYLIALQEVDNLLKTITLRYKSILIFLSDGLPTDRGKENHQIFVNRFVELKEKYSLSVSTMAFIHPVVVGRNDSSAALLKKIADATQGVYCESVGNVSAVIHTFREVASFLLNKSTV